MSLGDNFQSQAGMGAFQSQAGMGARRAVVLITGIQAAGKSTVAQLLAERLPRSVHVRGDLCRRVLAPSGVLVGIGAPKNGRWLGPMKRVVKIRAVAPAVSQKVTFFMARMNKDDLVVLHELLDSGKITPIVDRTYPLSEVPEAIRYLDTGHAKGKVVISI